MAHLALTDINNEKIHTFERFSRGAAGLAGADTDRLHVWLDDWSAGRGFTGDIPPAYPRPGKTRSTWTSPCSRARLSSSTVKTVSA